MALTGSTQIVFQRAALYLTFGSAVSVLFSVAVSHVLLALALAAFLISGERAKFPPVKLPLAVFFALTVLSLAFSADPAAGRPQLRKFYVFLILLLVASTFRELRQVHRLVVAWIGFGTLSAALALVQFYRKWEESHESGASFYDYYVGERITGFMSHWMTFGGQMMIVLLLLTAFVLFGVSARRRLALWLPCGAVIAAAVLLGFTRSIWLATGVGGLYLLWHWRRRLILLVPVALALGFWLGPGSVRARLVSVFQPHGERDSNQHRVVCWRTGWRMIQAHPLLGVGPEMVLREFDRYVPPDVFRPLPEGWYGHLHNIYLHYAAERGVPAMLALLWLLGRMLADFIRGLRKKPPPAGAWFLRGAVAAFFAVLVGGLFELNLGDTEVLSMFLAIAACGYVVLEQSGSRGQAPAPSA